MSEEILNTTTDVQLPEHEEKPYVDYSEKSLDEIAGIFAALLDAEDHQELYREAEALKSAFYKNLKKERAALQTDTEDAGDAGQEIPFLEEEGRFKMLYARYKADRAEYNARNEKMKEENLAKKLEIIEKVKALVEKGDVGHSFPEFRALQQTWREIGPIPATRAKDVYETYQHNVEMFYDLVSIDRELRDLDFKKNLEVKEKFCEMAEKLAENDNVVEAFRVLQKLHEEWKEFGPVAKEYREAVWDRFKKATAVINKKYQAHFEELKSQYRENLEAKQRLCEQVEEICRTQIASSGDWNRLSAEIEELQKQWKKIGSVARKDSQKVYDRFRAACDDFFSRKKEFYSEFKSKMQDNLSKKVSLCEQAEALMGSDNWKKTTEAFIELQRQWKEIGPVSRKKSEQLWKRFRTACDTFFENRDKNSDNPAIAYASNLRAKRALVAQVREYVLTGDAEADEKAMNDFSEKWNAIGFVPMKEKERVGKAFREAMEEKFPSYSQSRRVRGGRRQPQLSEREKLVQKYLRKEAELATYENNIGFFSHSSEAMIRQMREQIEASRAELAELEQQIRNLEGQEKSEE